MVFHRDTYFFDPNEDDVLDFNDLFTSYIEEAKVNKYEIVFLCIGSDRVTGDCLGPLTGSLLKDSFFKNRISYHVYGTLKSPVHALNISNTVKHLHDNHDKPFIIAIDASLSSKKNIGQITLSKGPLYPGKGVKKTIPAIGDISITGIVNSHSISSTEVLYGTRLHEVLTLSQNICHAILVGMSDFDSYASSSTTRWESLSFPL